MTVKIFDTPEVQDFLNAVAGLDTTLPPLDLLGTEGGSPFGPVGRFFYAGAEFKF